MKVETVRTTTFYLTLAASELILIQANSWQELPPLSHDVVLSPGPRPSPAYPANRKPEDPSLHANPPQILVRIQLRADYLNCFDLRTAGDDALELHLRPDEIADFNRNLVGPIVPLQNLPVSELLSIDTLLVGATRSLPRSAHPA